MFRRARKVRIYVRNKQRYDPSSKTRGFLFVDVENYVGTTIADIKEDIRKQTKGAVRIDELFLNNLPLADDRSVAHYNLQNETILETTSNPFWVSCLYIKAAEVRQEQEGHPNIEQIQTWTAKSIPKKYTLIGILLNSKKEKIKQPPHFPTLDDFLLYLESLNNKKGATMHPDYTQKDMRAFEREYRQDFLGKYDDPLSMFLDHYALRLGYLEPEDIDQPTRNVEVQPLNNDNNRVPQNHGRQKQGRLCEDCEMAIASLYCTDCPEGIALCEPCSDRLHAGVKRRRHNLQDIRQAPKNSKPYVPRAFLAPFALTVAMYRSLTEGKLSLTEEEIKKRAQPLTDTDLMDKQNGRYVGGFDCMENMLIAKGLVKKEAARVPTYALTESGHILGEKLYTFYLTFNSFLQQHNFPKINYSFLNKVAVNRKICLIIDEHERDKDRLLSFATDKHIDAQVRFLPAGDYVWVLSPPMYDVTDRYLGNDPANEMGSGLKNCYYLMEGSLSALKSNKSQHHQQHLKAQVVKLITEYGFYVNYTSSWMKSAQWLLWFSQLLIKGCNMGLFKDDCISYSEFTSRVARQAGSSKFCTAFRNAKKCYHKWTGQLFIDHIFRDNQGAQPMLEIVKQELNLSTKKKHLLVIQDLEQYNKKRQQTLTKCCEMVCSNLQNARGIVSDKIGLTIHNMVHYDISSFWQLNLQIILGVYVVRTENDEDSTKIQQKFVAGPQGPIPTLSPSKAKKGIPTKKVKKGHQDEQQTGDRPNNILREIQSNLRNITTVPASETSGYVDNMTDSRIDGSFTRIGTSPINDANFRKVPGSRKSNIHTFSSADISEDVAKHSFNNMDRSNLLGSCTNKSSTPSKKCSGVPLHMVRPFSGEGYCLGSRTDSDAPFQNDNIMESNLKLTGTLSPEHCQGGLLGGANETVDQDFTNVSIKTEDFVSSQDEEDILRKIMLESKADLDSLNNNNEDEMMRLAMELSKKEMQTKDRAGIGSEDEQMSLALERSMTENFVEKDMYQPTVEEEMEMVIERSKNDYTHNTCTDRSGTNRRNDNLPHEDTYQPTVEEEYEIAIERSKQEFENKVGGLQVGPRGDNLSHQDKYQATAEEELEMVLERSKRELSHNLYTKTCNHQAFTDSNEHIVEKNYLQTFDRSRLENSNNFRCADFKRDANKGVKRHISDVFESGENLETVNNNSELSELDELKIVLELSKKDAFKVSKHKQSNVEEKPVHQNSVESVNLDNPSNLDVEDAELKLAIERSKVENYSPKKRFKSGNQTDVYTKSDSIDNSKNKSKQIAGKDRNSEYESNHIEVILIDSQSQEVGEGHGIEGQSENSDANSCGSNNLEGFEDRALKRNLCGTERVSLSPSYDNDNYDSDKGKRHKFTMYKNNDQNTSEDPASIMSVNVKNHLSDDISVNTLHSYEKNGSKFKDKDLSSNDYICKSETVDDSDNDDCVLPSPDKVAVQGMNLTPLFSQRRRSLFNLSSQNSTPELENRISEKGRKCRKEFTETTQETKLSHERSLLDFDKVVPGDENISDSNKVPKKNNLLTQVFYDSSESENDTGGETDDDDNDDDENKMVNESRHCDTKGIVRDDGKIHVPGNICIMKDSQERVQFCVEEEPCKLDCNDNKHLLNRNKGFCAISDPESKGISNKISSLNEVKVNIKSEHTEDSCERLSGNPKNHNRLTDNENDHENDSDTLNNHSNDHEILNDYDNNCDALSDHDDDMLDIDFQPNSQDYDTESSAASDSDSEPDLDDGETLPVIGRPRIVKYKKVKSEIDRLVKEKQSKKDKGSSQEFGFPVRTIKTEKDTDYENEKSARSYNVDKDEQIARLMQSQFDSELNSMNSSKESDAEYARKLQDRLNNDVESSIKSENSTNITSVNSTSDEVYAKQLDVVLNGEKKRSDDVDQQYNSTNTPESVHLGANSHSEREREIEELQRKELEKIERWKRAILDDETLARQLQQLEKMEKEQAVEANSSCITSPSSSQYKPTKSDTSFKNMVALHKASREKALSQLNEYRQLQMDRFRSSRNLTNPGHNPATVNSTNEISLIDDEPVTATHRNTQHSVIQIDDEIPDRKFDGNMIKNRATDFPNYFHSPSNKQIKPPVHSESQVTDLDKLIGQSQQPSSSHVIISGQSQSEMKNSNITCGNCGEKGHNRTYNRCKMYHTAEETARRGVKMEKMKQKKEEKKQMEVETLNLLTNHQQVLEEMTEQIQSEMNTIQRRLKQKTTELEKQLSHRVKKLENNKKKGKR